MSGIRWMFAGAKGVSVQVALTKPGSCLKTACTTVHCVMVVK